ncbi:MAG: RNA polymerase sigma factor [Planctomycetota bacterium]
MRRAVAGDRRALEVLWVGSRRSLAAVLTAAGARASELPDLLQETAFALTRGIGTLRDPATFRGWLRRLALNTLSSAHRRPHEAALEGEPCASPFSPDDVDRTSAVRAALAVLPADYREPLLLKAVEGLSQRAIAGMLGVPETTVESRLVRARRLLREALQRRNCEGAPCAPRSGT